MDFVTGLLESHGNLVILTIVDCFSKAGHFMALPKLPSALETAELLTKHVVHLHGSLFHEFGEPAPSHEPGQLVWLSAKNNVPFIGPFPIDKISNSSAVKLKLLENMKIHTTFHVSQLKTHLPYFLPSI